MFEVAAEEKILYNSTFLSIRPKKIDSTCVLKTDLNYNSLYDLIN